MNAVGATFSASEDVEKLQDVIRQLEIQNAKLRSRVSPSKLTPKNEKKPKIRIAENMKVNHPNDNNLDELDLDQTLGSNFEQQIVEAS